MVHGALAVGGVSGVVTGLVVVGLWELGAHLMRYDCDWGRACNRRGRQDIEVCKEFNWFM